MDVKKKSSVTVLVSSITDTFLSFSPVRECRATMGSQTKEGLLGARLAAVFGTQDCSSLDLLYFLHKLSRFVFEKEKILWILSFSLTHNAKGHLASHSPWHFLLTPAPPGCASTRWWCLCLLHSADTCDRCQSPKGSLTSRSLAHMAHRSPILAGSVKQSATRGLQGGLFQALDCQYSIHTSAYRLDMRI